MGSIIQELESLFVGAGWNVIKVPVGRAGGTRSSPATPHGMRSCGCLSRTPSTANIQTLSAPMTARTTSSIFFGQNDPSGEGARRPL